MEIHGTGPELASHTQVHPPVSVPVWGPRPVPRLYLLFLYKKIKNTSTVWYQGTMVSGVWSGGQKLFLWDLQCPDRWHRTRSRWTHLWKTELVLFHSFRVEGSNSIQTRSTNPNPNHAFTTRSKKKIDFRKRSLNQCIRVV